MKYIKLFTLLAALIFSACSIFEEDDGVNLSTSFGRLIIENNMNVRIYYGIIDYEDVPLHDWAPFRNEEFSIMESDTKTIEFKNIYTTKERPLRKGDKVEVN